MLNCVRVLKYTLFSVENTLMSHAISVVVLGLLFEVGERMHRGWGVAHPQYCMCKAKDARKLHSLTTMLFTTSAQCR